MGVGVGAGVGVGGSARRVAQLGAGRTKGHKYVEAVRGLVRVREPRPEVLR